MLNRPPFLCYLQTKKSMARSPGTQGRQRYSCFQTEQASWWAKYIFQGRPVISPFIFLHSPFIFLNPPEFHHLQNVCYNCDFQFHGTRHIFAKYTSHGGFYCSINQWHFMYHPVTFFTLFNQLAEEIYWRIFSMTAEVR